jgi:ubiquitin carboxyl-terminal hydrolase 8
MLINQTSTTYDTFMYMSLPVPAGRKAVVVQELIDEFVKAEVLEGEDAWYVLRVTRSADPITES